MRSHRNTWLSGLTISLVAATVSGCVVEDRRYPNDYYYGGPYGTGTCATSQGAPAQASILSGAGVSFTTQAGNGTATAIEYLGAGVWHVFTTCDTNITRLPCAFDVTAEALGATVQQITLEGNDSASQSGPSSAVLSANTSTDVDGMRFTTTPGATVRFTALLDSCPNYQYLFWNDTSKVRGGAQDPAPSNPIDLVPTTP